MRKKYQGGKLATCDILNLCPKAIADPNDPDTILFWDTKDPETVVKIARDSWDQHVIDVKNGNYDNV